MKLKPFFKDHWDLIIALAVFILGNILIFLTPVPDVGFERLKLLVYAIWTYLIALGFLITALIRNLYNKKLNKNMIRWALTVVPIFVIIIKFVISKYS